MDGERGRPALALTQTLEALAAAEVAMWSWEPDADRLRVTGAARSVGLGPLAPECRGAALLALIAPQDRGRLEQLLRRDPHPDPFAHPLKLRTGQTLMLRGAWLEDERRAMGLAIPVRDAEVAAKDPLTGLLTRAAFLAGLDEKLRDDGRCGVVVADLARLRRLNEALGLARADMVLAALGARLSAAFPSHAHPARIGDGVFAVLTSGPAEQKAVRAALERPLRIGGFDIFPTLALGFAPREPGEVVEAAELLRRAELSVETAKAAGAASPPAAPDRGLSRLALESDIRGAITRGEIVPFFQPIVELADARLAGFEVLARWRHPRRGLLPPDEFLPLLSEAGLIPALEHAMIFGACAQLAAWRKGHPRAGDLTVSVNLSTGELGRDGLVQEVREALAEFKLPVGALKLEITEGEIMRDPERSAANLEALRDAGARLALDDFGMGFSSLSYLTRLPLETLKIDRYFVRTMSVNEGSAKIVRSVAGLARDLGLSVVAEGVETAAAARQLLAFGCGYGQGFGYSPPIDAREAEVYLNESYLDGAPLKVRA